MLEELTALLQDKKFTSVISYNGKGFDLPLLETRFTLNRLRCPLSALPHLDFYFRPDISGSINMKAAGFIIWPWPTWGLTGRKIFPQRRSPGGISSI